MKLGVFPAIFMLLTVFFAGCPQERMSPNPTVGGTSQMQYGSGQETANQLGGARSNDGLLQDLPPEKMAANTTAQDSKERTDWVTINEGPLSILFPDNPTRSRREIGIPLTKQTLLELKLGGMEFVVVVNDEPSPENIRAADEMGDSATRLKKGQEHTASYGKIQSERPIRFGNDIGLDYTMLRDDAVYHRTQTFNFGYRVATMIVTGPNPSDVTGADAEKFLNSFKWNGKSRTEANADRPADKPVAYEGKRYQVFTDVLSWHEAKEACEKRGGKLAVVIDANHSHFLTGLVIDAGLKEAWLGATDEADEGKWVTVDGAPIGYTNWNSGQPNNTDNNEHFLLLWAEKDGVWSDQPSVSTAHRPGYICQWD